LEQEALGLGLVAFADEMGGGHRFGQGIDALEFLAVVGHHLARAPQVVESQGAVLAAAIALRPFACRHGEIPIAHRPPLAQDGPHLGHGLGVLDPHSVDARIDDAAVVALAMHDHPPMGQLVHRPRRQPAAPIEELALLIGRLFPQAGRVIEHAAVQLDVLTAGDDLQGIELQVFHLAHGLRRARDALPTPPRP